MTEKEARNIVSRFLHKSVRKVVVPAALGIGLAFSGCGDTGDQDSRDRTVQTGGKADNTGGNGWITPKYAAPFPAQDGGVITPKYAAPFPAQDAGAITPKYAAPFPAQDAGAITPKYAAPFPEQDAGAITPKYAAPFPAQDAGTMTPKYAAPFPEGKA